MAEGNYTHVERRKVIIDLELRGKVGPTRNELPEPPRFAGRRFEDAVERAVRRILERGGRT